MKVATITQLAASGELKKDTDIQAEGFVTHKWDPKTLRGVHDGKPYAFVVQKVVIKDQNSKTGDGLVADLNYPDGSIGMQSTGNFITVKGKLGSYDKDGKTNWTIERARVLDERGAGEVKEVQQQADKANQQMDTFFGGGGKKSSDTEARICRQNALSASVALYASGSKWNEEDVLRTAELFSRWTITGDMPQLDVAVPNTPSALADTIPF